MLTNRVKVLKMANIAATALLVLLICCLFFNIGGGAAPCFGQGAIKVYGIREYCENKDIVVDINRPEVSGFSNKAFEKLLNKKIENNISAHKINAELCSLRRKSGEFQYYLSADYWLLSSEGIFSLKVTTDFEFYWITNLPITEYYNADIANNKLLTLGDLFADDSYKERIKSFLTDAIKQRWPIYQDDWFKDKILTQGISDKTSFFIMDGNLYIAFAKYEITDGSAGEPEFLIPTEEIEDLLKPEYKGIFN